MDLHSLTNTTGARHRRKRLGRGPASGQGKTSGKGHKGQMARKGGKHKLAFEGGQMPLVRRIPKRGFTNYTRKEFIGVNLMSLDRFEEGADVTIEVLRQAGLANGPSDGIKILGRGEISKKLTVKANAFSASAREKIEAAGGVCEVV
jgi:large subunit ribosomal protein L15